MLIIYYIYKYYFFVLLFAFVPTTTSFSFSSKSSSSKYKSSSSISSIALKSSLSLSSSLSSSSSFVDFSSPSEWEAFYREEEQEQEEEQVSGGVVSSSEASPTEAKFVSSATTTQHITEWHSSISLDDLASIVPSNGRCLLIGCGNSLLPDQILLRQKHLPMITPPLRSLVLLDTSPTCLDQLRQRLDTSTSTTTKTSTTTSTSTTQENENEDNDEYDNELLDNNSKININTNNSRTKIDYICGDATKLSTYFDTSTTTTTTTTTTTINNNNNINNNKDDGIYIDDNDNLFDMIIDKGLTDAILCNEGWDGILEQLFTESAKILSKEDEEGGGGGRYLLISYQLPSSTKDFIIQIGEQVGLEWDFDYQLPTSSSVVPTTMTPPTPTLTPPTGHQRVSVAMATCKRRRMVDS